LDRAHAFKVAQHQADAEELKREAEKLKQHERPASVGDTRKSSKEETKQSLIEQKRKDAPPYKVSMYFLQTCMTNEEQELSTILNLQRLLGIPHTAEQLSALWTAYHASRSGGTGRGFVCASIPLPIYEKMTKNGRGYPTFVVPVPRVQQPSDTSQLPASSLGRQENTAHEFYFLQWDFHPPPPIPSASDDPFLKPLYTNSAGVSNPPISTVLYAPLQEYKVRQTFATPYLVLTMYTDLAASHGIVLLRGEITPSTSVSQGSSSDRYMISQEDAQLLTIALQRFYLWSDEGSTEEEEFGTEGKELLIAFHKRPDEFKWQDLLKFSNLTL
jgi:ATP synthase F1 complex assembly factor 1